MPTLETIAEGDLRGPLKAKSLRRAKRYLNRVQNPVCRGQTLTAKVQGTYLYDVEVDVVPEGIRAHCSCPYNWGGYCKHIGALVLKWIRSPQSFTIEEAPPVVEGYPIRAKSVDPPPTQPTEELPFWLKSPLADRQAADEGQLSEWLGEVPIQDLRDVAEERGWKAHGIRKDRVIRQVVQHLTNPDETLQAILDLDDEHRRVLCALLVLGWDFNSQSHALERIATLWGELAGYEQIETYTRHLCAVGLAVPGDALVTRRHQSDVVPRAVARCFPAMLSPRLGLWPIVDRPDGDVALQLVDEVRPGDPHTFLQATGKIISLLEGSPSPLRSPMPRPRLEKFHRALQGWDYVPEELRQAREDDAFDLYSDLVLTVPPPHYSLPDETIEHLAPVAGGEARGAARLEFIFSLLVATGVFQLGSPVTVWPEVQAEFLRRDAEERRAVLAQVYFRMTNWSALWEVLRRPSSQLELKRLFRARYLTPERLRSQLVGFRHLVLRVLASLPDGEWVTVEDVVRLMRAAWRRFDYDAWQANPSRRRPDWFLTVDGDRPLQPGAEWHWQQAQGQFIRTMITGPLHWLGLADLGLDEDGGLVAVCFHGLADLYWDRGAAPPLPTHTRAAAGGPTISSEEVVTFDQQTVRVEPSRVGGEVHGMLNRIARLETAAADCFVYQVNPQTVYETLEAGATLSEILDHWERVMPVSMPRVIRTRLDEWWEAYGQVRIYDDITVIEFGDDYALAEMKAVTSLEDHLLVEVSPRLVIIPQHAVEPLVAELEAAGHTPRQTDEV